MGSMIDPANRASSHGRSKHQQPDELARRRQLAVSLLSVVTALVLLVIVLSLA